MNIHSYMYQRDKENHSVPKNLTWFKNYEFICFSWYFDSDEDAYNPRYSNYFITNYIRARAYERQFQS